MSNDNAKNATATPIIKSINKYGLYVLKYAVSTGNEINNPNGTANIKRFLIIDGNIEIGYLT